MEQLLNKNQIEKLNEARALVQKGREIVESVLQENHNFFITQNGQSLDKCIRHTAHSLELLTLTDNEKLIANKKKYLDDSRDVFAKIANGVKVNIIDLPESNVYIFDVIELNSPEALQKLRGNLIGISIGVKPFRSFKIAFNPDLTKCKIIPEDKDTFAIEHVEYKDIIVAEKGPDLLFKY